METLINEIRQKTLMPPTLSVGAAMFKIPQQIRVVSLTLTALLCLFSAGCGVPLRVPTKTSGVSGEFGKKFDLSKKSTTSAIRTSSRPCPHWPLKIRAVP
jgi:hypothetical protein